MSSERRGHICSGCMHNNCTHLLIFKEPIKESWGERLQNVESWNFNVIFFAYFLHFVYVLSNYFGKYICFDTCRIIASCRFHSGGEEYLNFSFGTCQTVVQQTRNQREDRIHACEYYFAMANNCHVSFSHPKWQMVLLAWNFTSARWEGKCVLQSNISWHHRFYSD